MNTCILPDECPANTTHMGRCDGNSDLDTSYCLPNEVWCDDESCWGPDNKYSDSWEYSAAKGSLLTCADAFTFQNSNYPDRSHKNPNPDAYRYPGHGCRQGIKYCGVSDYNEVGKNSYQNPDGKDEFHKITHWLWPDTFQRHCVLKPELKG